VPLWSELTRIRFERALKNTHVAIMVTGALEAHGNHLPLGTDSINPAYLADRVARRTKALVLPPIPFGDSWSFDVFKGTVSLRPETLLMVYRDVMTAVLRQGITFLVALNGHGPNASILQQAAQAATEGSSGAVIIVNWWLDVAKEARAKVLQTPEGHAAEDETSEVLAVRPDLVDLSAARRARVRTEFRIVSASRRETLLPGGMYGEPERATSEKGKTIMQAAEDELVKLVQGLEQGKLPIVD
jgi:creatinine amidohydrolase